MKSISLLVTFVACFATLSYASPKEMQPLDVHSGSYISGEKLQDALLPAVLQTALPRATCKVTETWTNKDGTTSSATVTVTCDCTTQQACDAAHAIISILVPNV